MKLDQIWRLLGTHGTTECNGKFKHISVIRKNMIAVYYNGITLRKKLYRKSCHSVCAVPQSQISRNRYVQKYGRARKPDTAHLAMPTLGSWNLQLNSTFLK